MIINFTHPEYGPLTIKEAIGRSRRCEKPDGTSVQISSRVINSLTKSPATDLVTTVAAALAAMPDDVTRVQVAKEIWHLADKYVEGKQ